MTATAENFVLQWSPEQSCLLRCLGEWMIDISVISLSLALPYFFVRTFSFSRECVICHQISCALRDVHTCATCGSHINTTSFICSWYVRTSKNCPRHVYLEKIEGWCLGANRDGWKNCLLTHTCAFTAVFISITDDNRGGSIHDSDFKESSLWQFSPTQSNPEKSPYVGTSGNLNLTRI